MNRRPTWIAAALAAICFTLVIAEMALAGLNHESIARFLDQDSFPVAFAIAFPVVGAIVVSRRPRNVVAWLLLIGPLFAILTEVAETYAHRALVTAPGTLPFGPFASWVEAWTWVPMVATLPLLLQLFPDGQPLSQRWRWVTWMTLGETALLMFGLMSTWPMRGLDLLRQGEGSSTAQLPELASVVAATFPIVLAMTVAGTISIVLRFARARGEEREQMKWFTIAIALVALEFVASAIGDATGAYALGDVWAATAIVPAAVAFGVAILKYRLYDIDVVINKTVVYVGLAAFITAVYVGIVAGVGALIGRGDRPSLGLSIAATAIVAVAFAPVKQRVQRVANRLVYGTRATPYEVLSEFSRRMGDAYASVDLIPRMARILAEGTGATRARVWLRVGADLRPEASWPAAEPAGMAVAVPMANGHLPGIPEVSLALAVRHRDEMLGALTLTKPAGERLTPAEEHLARDLASQAGLVMRNVRLTEELLLRLDELQGSRRRIVAAQDEERRRLERNIHDGAQQQLVALAVKVRLARQLNDRDPVRASRQLEEVEVELGQALEDLRDLARGIYPPLLADRGLEAALRSQASKAAVPVRVEAADLGRYAQDREAAVYFCCLEALQNVAKYARASSVVVRLREQDGDLVFDVTDDGAGFDPATTGYGTGLRGMADRLEALGGHLRVESAPQRGTTVNGRIPGSTGDPEPAASTPAPDTLGR